MADEQAVQQGTRAVMLATELQEGLRAMAARGLVSLAIAILPECGTRRWLRDMRDIWRQRVRELEESDAR
jgi:hypothetical protein